MNKTIDTRMIIVNLLKEDQKTYISVDRLQRLIIFIYKELAAKHQLKQYQIFFDINFDSIERTVLYNNNIFRLDIDGDMIYLRDVDSMDDLAEKYRADKTIIEIIDEFIQHAA